MKPTAFTVTVVLLAVFVTGCEPANRTSEQDRLPESATEQYQEARKEAREAVEKNKEAARATGSLAEAEKTAFIVQMEQRVAALRTEAEDLKVRVANTTDVVKAEGQKKLDDLKRQADQLQEQLTGLRNASESNWESLKDGFETAYDQTRAAFNDARQWLSEKIAPGQG